MNLLSLFKDYAEQIETIQLLLLLISVGVHVLFAGAVAKDAGDFHKRGLPTALVSPGAWAFATLLGGVYVAVCYWFIHHSTLTKVRVEPLGESHGR